MLAAIIANLQDVEPARTAKLPTVTVDRGGGGPSWPSYDVVDILAAIQAFPEVAGEDPVLRAVRRARWIGEALPRIREAREKREAGVFLTGAQLGYAAGYEAGHAEAGQSSSPKPVPAPVAAERQTIASRATRDRGDSGSVLAVFALALGALGAAALMRRRR